MQLSVSKDKSSNRPIALTEEEYIQHKMDVSPSKSLDLFANSGILYDSCR